MNVKINVLVSLITGFQFAPLSEIYSFKHKLMLHFSVKEYPSFSEMRNFILELITPELGIPENIINKIPKTKEEVIEAFGCDSIENSFVLSLN